jgi:hypothetical protein
MKGNIYLDQLVYIITIEDRIQNSEFRINNQ